MLVAGGGKSVAARCLGGLASACLAVALVSCAPAAAPLPGVSEPSSASPEPTTKLDAFRGLKGTITVGGATTLEPLARAVCDRISQRYPDVTFVVEGGGSEVGVSETGKGRFGVGLATRDLDTQEQEAYPEMRVYAFAHEGLGVVVHPSNPVSSLTTTQLADIFAGRIRDWSQVGGKPGTIDVYQREAAQAGSLQLRNYLKVDRFGPAKAVPAETQEMHNLVADDPDAIGYIGFSVGSANVKFLELEGVKPLEENVSNGTWVMIRTERLLTKGEPTGLAKAYVEYFLSSECEDLVRKSGFLPLKK